MPSGFYSGSEDSDLWPHSVITHLSPAPGLAPLLGLGTAGGWEAGLPVRSEEAISAEVGRACLEGCKGRAMPRRRPSVSCWLMLPARDSHKCQRKALSCGESVRWEEAPAPCSVPSACSSQADLSLGLPPPPLPLLHVLSIPLTVPFPGLESPGLQPGWVLDRLSLLCSPLGSRTCTLLPSSEPGLRGVGPEEGAPHLHQHAA